MIDDYEALDLDGWKIENQINWKEYFSFDTTLFFRILPLFQLIITNKKESKNEFKDYNLATVWVKN